MDLFEIGATLWRHKRVSIPLVLLTVFGVLYVLAAKAPTYQAKANLLLANSPAPPTAMEIAQDPSLARVNNPYANLGNLVYLADVLTEVVAAPDAKQALVQAGVSGYQIAVDDSDQTEIPPAIDITGTGRSAAAAIESAQLVASAISRELYQLQADRHVQGKFMITAVEYITPTSAAKLSSRKLQTAIGIAVIGLFLLLVAVSAAQGLAERRNGRPRHGSQPDYHADGHREPAGSPAGEPYEDSDITYSDHHVPYGDSLALSRLAPASIGESQSASPDRRPGMRPAAGSCNSGDQLADADLAVITPSYAPDLELCSDLNESVLRNTPAAVRHYIITPRRDVKLFSRLRGTRTEVLSVDEVLPRHVWPVPGANFWLNARRPWPPVRGWVLQQVIKLQIAAQVDVGLLLLADSDVLLVRPVSAETFRVGGRTCFYRRDNEIGSGMPRHLMWCDVASKLLGVPPAPPPHPDYISPFNVWERRIAIALQERIQQTTGRHWLDAITGQLHFSEFVLYGMFVDKVLGAGANVTETRSMLCHTYWKRTPLDTAEAGKFVREMPPDDVAIMISAKSGTPLEVRRKTLLMHQKNLADTPAAGGGLLPESTP